MTGRMTDHKIFPIQSDTACLLKWSWSTLRLYAGNSSSCHRVAADPLDVDNFDDFHNSPKKLADRSLMLEGQWPTGGCEYCKNIEAVGGFSDRQLHLNDVDKTPTELFSNNTSIKVNPTILEVYFNNVCNMSCLYCYDGFSSKIQQENIKYGRFEHQGVVIENTTRQADTQSLTVALWKWMAQNHQSIKRFNVLGGEPFYQEQFWQCLDFFDQHPCPDLDLNVVSNLMISDERFEQAIDKIAKLHTEKKIRSFDLMASIDCFGPEQEYVRFGLDLDQWRRNFELAVSKKWITLNINQTLSNLTLKTVPELLSYINSFRQSRDIGQWFSTVQFKPWLHPGILGPGFFDNDFATILAQMPTNNPWQVHAINYMTGIQKQINSMPRDPKKLNQLRVFLTEMDRRRHTSWSETFPWLVDQFDNVV